MGSAKTPTSMPLLSICISLYNYEQYIGELLDSVIDQDYPNIEIVVVDDASTDGSLAVVEQYRARAPYPLRILRNPTNRGSSYTTRRSIDESSGEYFVTIAADDVLERRSLDYPMRRLMAQPDAVCFIGNGRYLKEARLSKTVLHDARKMALLSQTPNQILNWLYVYPEGIWLGAIIYRRDFYDAIGGIPDVPCEDWGLHIRVFRGLMEQGKTCLMDGDRFLLRFRIHGGSMSSDVYKHMIKKTLTIRRMTPRHLWLAALYNNYFKAVGICESQGQTELGQRFRNRLQQLREKITLRKRQHEQAEAFR